MTTHGGKRPNSGRKAGRTAQTLDKLAAREKIRAMVFAALEPLVSAQIANASGLKYLVARDKRTGKFERVSEAMARLANNEEHIEVWEKDPSVQAFTDLLNRAVDKPIEQVEHDVQGAIVIRWQE